MHLSLYLLAGILKKAAVVFGAILIVTGFLFLLNEYRLRSTYGPPITGTGTLRYGTSISLGHVWYITTDNGTEYIISIDSFLPDEFKVYGLRVEFTGYRTGLVWTKDVISPGDEPSGKVIMLIDIRKL